MQLPLPLLALLQRSIDEVIQRNPQTEDTLSELNGSVFQVDVLTLDISLFLIFTERGIELARAFDSEVDVKFSGSPIALMSMIRSNNALFKGEVDVVGDVAKSRIFKQLVTSVELDLEEELSTVVGDTAAHQLFRVHNRIASFFNRTAERTQLDTRDYLQEEAQLLPHPTELSSFNSAVDELRAGVDRFEARLNIISRKSEESS